MKKQYKLLIIDDRLENLFALSAVLKSKGYLYDTAQSGSIGLDLMKNNDYGLVILDVQMPEMNGFEVAQKIKQDERLNDIPIIFLSANTPDEKNFQRGYKSGALDYLTKPVDEYLLTLKVENFLQLYHQKILLKKNNLALEKRAVQAEISYKGLYYSLTSDIFLIDTEGVIVDINKTDSLVCGLLVRDCLHKHVLSVPFLKEIFENNNHKKIDQLYQDFLVGPQIKEFSFEKADGSIFFGEAILSCAILSAMPHMQICINDITESHNNKLNLAKEIRVAKRFQSISLSSQMNPHFMYNALNSIQYFILSGDNSEEALNFVADFSQLMRLSLSNSRSEFIKISDEILFLESYLKLEQKRLNSKFAYTIKFPANQNPDELYIPPMLLQPYIENAIIHGISNISENAQVNLSFTLRGKTLVCKITDNGIGRKNSLKQKSLIAQDKIHESLGMNITATKIKLLNDLYGESFFIKITDLVTKEGVACGTEVRFELPRFFSDDLFNLSD